MDLTLTDPTTHPTYGDGPISHWCQRHLHESRDEVFVRLTLKMLVVQSALMVAAYFAVNDPRIPWGFTALVYMALWGYAVPPVILMLHCTMHRRFLRDAKSLERAHPWVMSFLLGVPAAYRDHHIGMHHVENNMGPDLSSTLTYQRDSFAHFLAYFFRFFFLGVIEVPRYLQQNKRGHMARRALAGEVAQWAFMAGALALDWRFGVVCFVLPYLTCRFMMMAGNWGQHAFVNTDHKNSGIANAITCINSGYNRRCFNDGYHIGHHLHPNRHWTEMPNDFLASRERLANEGAIVFERLDFFLVALLLWTGQWRVLAKRYVRLGSPMTDEQVIALLKERVKPVHVWPAENIGVALSTGA